MTSSYDPYNGVSFVELNKQRRNDSERRPSEKIENRYSQPAVKRIYIKANGEAKSKRPKLFVWRRWQSPSLAGLRADMAPYVGLDMASAIYDVNGQRITSEDQIREYGTYYVVGDEDLFIPDSDDDYDSGKQREWLTGAGRATSMSAPNMVASRQSLYDGAPSPPTPPPKPFQSDNVTTERLKHRAATAQNTTVSARKLARPNSVNAMNDWDEYEKFYKDAITSTSSNTRKKSQNRRYEARPQYDNRRDDEFNKRHMRRYYDENGDGGHPASDGYQSNDDRFRQKSKNNQLNRSRSANDFYSNDDFVSDFDTELNRRKDKEALAKHRQNQSKQLRSSSDAIYNRKDQTHPDAYIIYVFLNGQGMECQYLNFQKKQLAKGMSYVLELIARRFNVNPSRLCDMDGRRITDPSQLMSRGAYVLVAAGQSFRDSWYFLPDNAIDTSSNQQRVDDRNDQRDRLLQRRERRERAKLKSRKMRENKESNYRTQRTETVVPGRRFGSTY
ncbi:hypothetical protein Q1695_000206 [Nippostrongylus brasiliensis]|nr:hypothetical protein Q1695_000206 [Nippostrongylus brasiliensis]